MGLRPVEQLMARRQIAEMIRRNPTDIRLSRREKIKTPSGGWRYGPSTLLKPQRVMVTALKRRLTDNTVDTEMGTILDADYVLTGFYDLDVERDDEFTHEGEHYKVTQVIRKEDRTLAIAENTGGDTDG